MHLFMVLLKFKVPDRVNPSEKLTPWQWIAIGAGLAVMAFCLIVK
jgi:hypothetical protein